MSADGVLLPFARNCSTGDGSTLPGRNSNNVPEGSYMTQPPPLAPPGALFVDWLDIWQEHPSADGSKLPLVAGSLRLESTPEGEVTRQWVTSYQVPGSFDTSLLVRCDGHRVTLSGNPGRWGRADNVFGFGLADCVQIANRILIGLGLPPFTDEAHISRIDLTRNYSLGSRSDALAWIASASCLRPNRGGDKGQLFPNGTACDYFRGSKRKYLKIYLKSSEITDNRKRKKRGRKGVPVDHEAHEAQSQYLRDLSAWCDSCGLVRIELKLMSTQLGDLGLHRLGRALKEAKKMADIYEKETAFLRRGISNVHRLSVDDFQRQLLNAYPDWSPRTALFHARLAQAYYNGESFSDVNKETRKRYRRVLYVLGIDITAPLNVAALPVRVRVVEAQPVAVPVFYQTHIAA